MEGYWISAIIQNDWDDKAWLLSMSEPEPNLNSAIDVIEQTRVNHNVLAAWVEVHDKDNSSYKVVFHECYINIFGSIK